MAGREEYHIRPTHEKLDNKQHRLFEIESKVGASDYKLKLPPTRKSIHPVFNEVLLSPLTPPAFPSQKAPHLPLL